MISSKHTALTAKYVPAKEISSSAWLLLYLYQLESPLQTSILHSALYSKSMFRVLNLSLPQMYLDTASNLGFCNFSSPCSIPQESKSTHPGGPGHYRDPYSLRWAPWSTKWIEQEELKQQEAAENQAVEKCEEQFKKSLQKTKTMSKKVSGNLKNRISYDYLRRECSEYTLNCRVSQIYSY